MKSSSSSLRYRKTKRKVNMKKRGGKRKTIKNKKKYIKKQKGGFNYLGYALQDIEYPTPGRFSISQLIEPNILIIDNKYNRKYLKNISDPLIKYFILVDEDTKDYYAFKKVGDKLIEIVRLKDQEEILKDIKFIESVIEEDSFTHNLSKNGIAKIILQNKKSCYIPINLDVVKRKLDDINKEIRKFEGNLNKIEMNNDFPIEGADLTLWFTINDSFIDIYRIGLVREGNKVIFRYSGRDDTVHNDVFIFLYLRLAAMMISSLLICNKDGERITVVEDHNDIKRESVMLLNTFSDIIVNREDDREPTYNQLIEKTKEIFPRLSDYDIIRLLVLEPPNGYVIYTIEIPLHEKNIKIAESLFTVLLKRSNSIIDDKSLSEEEDSSSEEEEDSQVNLYSPVISDITLFDKALLNEYTARIKDTYPLKEIKDYKDLYNSGPIDLESLCPKLNTYLKNTLSFAHSKSIKIDLIYINYPGTNRVCSILIAQYGECTEYPNVWSIRLICSNDSVECKNNATILLGAYCWCLKKKDHKIGLLELAGAYNNLPGYCSYFKFGFAEPKSLMNFKCTQFSKNNLPMITELKTMTFDDIIETVKLNKKIREKREIKKPIICSLKENQSLQSTRQVLENAFHKKILEPKKIPVMPRATVLTRLK